MHCAMSTPTSAATTKVVGYLNPNDFPVQINLSSLGLTVTLPPKAYLMNRLGQKINDPALDKLVRPGGLSREEGKVELPLVLVKPPAPVAENTSQFSFAGTNNPQIDEHGKIKELPKKAEGGGSNQRNPVTGYSMEEARRLKLIDTPPDESLVQTPTERVLAPNPTPVEPAAKPAGLEEIDTAGYTPPADLALLTPPQLATPPTAPPAVAPPVEPKALVESAPAANAVKPKRKRRTKEEIANAAKPGKDPLNLPQPKV